VAAGRADRVGGRDDARTGHVALVDRLAQAHVVELGRADVANGGEAGLQGDLGVAGLDHAPEGVAVLQAVVAADLGDAVEMDVHVDQARQQGRARQVDHLGPGRNRVARLAHRRDPAVGDHHLRIVDILAGGHVEQPRGAHHLDLRRLRQRRGAGRRQESQSGQFTLHDHYPKPSPGSPGHRGR
jgi:hypothetical protein